MNADTLQILISMVLYMGVVILIGVLYAKRANKNSEEYFLGGRSLGPWVTAMSAEASDMSGWLLMGRLWCNLWTADFVLPVLEAHQQSRCHCRYGWRWCHGIHLEAGHFQAGRRV